MIRILQVNDPFEWGGVALWLIRLLPHLRAQGIEVDLLASSVDAAHEKSIRQAGCRLFLGPKPRAIFSYSQNLRRVLRNHGPYDVIHSHFPQHTGLILREASRAGVPVRIAHSHSDLRQTMHMLGLLSRTYMSFGRMLIPRYATCGLADSRNAAASLFGEAWAKDSRWRVIPLGIDLTAFDSSCCVHDTRSSLRISPDAFVIGHVGRLSIEKNHAFILEIAAEVIRTDPKAQFLMIGDGPLREPLERRIRQLNLMENVHLLGSRADIPCLLRALDVFLFPSLCEGFGLALVEAQAAGLPCIAATTIPREADVVPGFVQRLSLTDSAAVWAEALLACRHTPPTAEAKYAALQVVQRSSCTIENSALWLGSLYQRSQAALSART
jgi:glycosyltransferase involved in cell wall biosynthesis